MYGPYTNEELVGRAIAGRRDEVVLATKFGIVRDPSRSGASAASTAVPSTCARRCEASLKRLGVDTIDLYYLHRVDRDVPIEDTVGAMAELVRAGKVRYLGLSEASAETLARACDGASDRGAAERVFALDARSRGRRARRLPRARHRLRRRTARSAAAS